MDRTPSSVAKRVGYLLGATANVVLLWAAHRLLGWGRPGFLTEDFTGVLPWITAACVVGIIGYGAMFVAAERFFPRLLNDAVTAGVSCLGIWRTLQIFPFDFSTYDVDWSWPLRVLLGVALIGAFFGLVVSTFKLLTWPWRAPS